MFQGVYTALITPFRTDGSVDEAALRRIVNAQIEAGIAGLVPMGTTGESPTVSHAENMRVIEIVIEEANGRVPVIAGTGSNSTSEAVDMTRQARDLGAAASLQRRRCDGSLQIVVSFCIAPPRTVSECG